MALTLEVLCAQAHVQPDPFRNGWAVFQVDGQYLQIQKFDEEDIISDDVDAVAYVMARACRYGCPQARQALKDIVDSWKEGAGL